MDIGYYESCTFGIVPIVSHDYHNRCLLLSLGTRGFCLVSLILGKSLGIRKLDWLSTSIPFAETESMIRPKKARHGKVIMGWICMGDGR